MKREELPEEEGGAYFDDERVETFSSGCSLLDCALGGGWGIGRVANVVGDSSTGKTLLAIEACTNFHRKFPEAPIHYVETEAAFDIGYARSLGLPVEAVTFPDPQISTVEELQEYIQEKVLKKPKKGTKKIVSGSEQPGLLVIDSMDALSDEAEKEADPTKGTYGTAKAKQMSKAFRRFIIDLDQSRVTSFLVSQVRENIGVTFGKKYYRAGGKSLDFYSTHIVWLAHIGREGRTVKGVKRVTGVNIKAKVEKNKIGPSFREAEFPILFGFGIEDVVAGINFLNEVGRRDWLFSSEKEMKRVLEGLDELESKEYRILRKKVVKATKKAWAEIEADFAPRRSKY